MDALIKALFFITPQRKLLPSSWRDRKLFDDLEVFDVLEDSDTLKIYRKSYQ